MAVVGSAGVIGHIHVDEIVELESTVLAGVQDVNQVGARGQAEELGVKYYETLDDLLGDPGVDAISIATPHPLHHEDALKAFEAGKHVLSEKPIAESPSKADEMVEAAREAGLTLGVVFQQRFRPEVVRMHQMLQEGAVGRIYRTSLVVHNYRSQGYYDSAAWRGTWAGEGGGVLMNQAPHFLDMFQWLCGMPATVQGTVANLMHDIEVEDSATAVLEYADGARGTIHCDTVQTPSIQLVEVWGDKGALLLRDNKLTYQHFETPLREFSDADKAGSSKGPEARMEAIKVEDRPAVHGDAVDDFARALMEGRDPSGPGAEGVRSLELAAAIILSGCRRERGDLPVDRQAYDDLLSELRERRGLLQGRVRVMGEPGDFAGDV